MRQPESSYRLDTPQPQREAGPIAQSIQAPLPSGWLCLQDCNISGVLNRPAPMRYVLLHAEIGIALLDVAPAETQDAEAILRHRLTAARFEGIFSGHLPVVHLRIAPEDLPNIDSLLGEAFAALPPLSVPGGDAWVSVVRRALSPRDPNRSASPLGASAPEPRAVEPHLVERHMAELDTPAPGASGLFARPVFNRTPPPPPGQSGAAGGAGGQRRAGPGRPPRSIPRRDLRRLAGPGHPAPPPLGLGSGRARDPGRAFGPGRRDGRRIGLRGRAGGGAPARAGCRAFPASGHVRPGRPGHRLGFRFLAGRDATCPGCPRDGLSAGTSTCRTTAPGRTGRRAGQGASRRTGRSTRRGAGPQCQRPRQRPCPPRAARGSPAARQPGPGAAGGGEIAGQSQDRAGHQYQRDPHHAAGRDLPGA
ncbi:hypothetical protein [Siccirubricoccus sp. G192]|uniref:hypothetical protein n=1 Tax=Siccirubricoccus sp. G192 TaxID=2849651 RepID=UPI0020C3970C|nr:hypothetical protein [Siccirubricoccus sp. G192]